MRTSIILLTVSSLLTFCVPVYADTLTLVPVFDRLRTESAEHQPIERLRRFFAPTIQGELGDSFTQEWVAQFASRVTDSSRLVERVKDTEGCLAYSMPYRAKATGHWVELSTFTYSHVDGEWLITDSMYSISADHHIVEGEDYCLRLGWPWL
jgi:hypothetical protein